MPRRYRAAWLIAVSGLTGSAGAVSEPGLRQYNPNVMKATAKQEAQNILDALPDDASLEQIQYHLYVVQKIEAGLRDVEEGRLVSQEEVERRIATWPER